ncbi:MAG: hypothetical protein MZV70_73525 [Desulfobacterales bacterium]|nr:hypothetical protein [Desulfobacterales bacterium]
MIGIESTSNLCRSGKKLYLLRHGFSQAKNSPTTDFQSCLPYRAYCLDVILIVIGAFSQTDGKKERGLQIMMTGHRTGRLETDRGFPINNAEGARRVYAAFTSDAAESSASDPLKFFTGSNACAAGYDAKAA